MEVYKQKPKRPSVLVLHCDSGLSRRNNEVNPIMAIKLCFRKRRCINKNSALTKRIDTCMGRALHFALWPIKKRMPNTVHAPERFAADYVLICLGLQRFTSCKAFCLLLLVYRRKSIEFHSQQQTWLNAIWEAKNRHLLKVKGFCVVNNFRKMSWPRTNHFW